MNRKRKIEKTLENGNESLIKCIIDNDDSDVEKDELQYIGSDGNSSEVKKAKPSSKNSTAPKIAEKSLKRSNPKNTLKTAKNAKIASEQDTEVTATISKSKSASKAKKLEVSQPNVITLLITHSVYVTSFYR